ncbi:MAG: transposase [Flavobacteriales bacterium]|nr:transposase [Flavobacteriales bacterium]MCB9166407.1 transposase [Flavobacteriales bacterium]
MSRRYKIHDQEDLHFLTYAVLGWVDALSRPEYKNIIVDSLAHCQQEKGLALFAWCVMSNHVHLIAKADGGGRLQDILRDHKKFTAKKVVEAITANLQESRSAWMLPLLKSATGAIHFWQHDLHPIWLRTPAVICQKLDYIHENPVQAGLVAEPHHYL